jgi:leucyl aminopeptidase
MNTEVTQGILQQYDADTLIVNLFENTEPAGAPAAMNEALGGEINRLRALGDFKGTLNSVLTLYPNTSFPAERIIVVGLGKQSEFSAARAIEAVGTAVKEADSLGATHIATVAFGAGAGSLSPSEAAEMTIIGAKLSLYRYDRFKTFGSLVENEISVETVRIVEFDPTKIVELKAGAEIGCILADSVALARDLQNTPAGHLTPTMLADQASLLCADIDVECHILKPTDMTKLGMGALLGVARGSAEEPRMIVMDYNPSDQSNLTVAVCGKGVTFDTGGISIKPSLNMGDMKFDMSGSSATLGVIRSAALMKLPLRVVGIIPAVENMPSGHAIRPGDVLTAMNGKTIEVDNTDAEGRLILADALCYAQRFKPDAMIDLATLTGAVIIALGHHATGMMGTNEDLKQRLTRAGDHTGERVWELPLWDEYESGIEGKIADINNTGGRPAGTINGGMFLKHFVGDTPWCHLDIAGTAWDVKENSYIGPGGTGVGVRLLTRLLQEWACSPSSG